MTVGSDRHQGTNPVFITAILALDSIEVFEQNTTKIKWTKFLSNDENLQTKFVHEQIPHAI